MSRFDGTDEVELLTRARQRLAQLQIKMQVYEAETASWAGGGAGPLRASAAAPAFYARPPRPEDEELRRAPSGGSGGGGGGSSRGQPVALRSSVASPDPRPTNPPTPVQTKKALSHGAQAAVVKVASYAGGRARIAGLVNYQSREGAIALEREDGTKVEGPDALQALIDSWADEATEREPSKDVLGVTLTLPTSIEPEQLAHQVERFCEGHRYAWRLEAGEAGATVHLVMSAASTRRDDEDKPIRIWERNKSLAAFNERARDAFGESVTVSQPRFDHGVEGVSLQLRQSSASGTLPMTLSNGQTLSSKDQALSVARSWKRDLRSNSQRDVVHIILSAKPGTPEEAFVDAARETLARSFPGYQFAFAVHTDRHHLHVHAVVRMERGDGQRLRPGIRELRQWRETMAEEARQRHIPMYAVSRFDQAHTPAYKLGDIRAAERGNPTEWQRRRLEARKTGAVHVPTRPEGLQRATRVRQEWAIAARRPIEPPVAPGVTRLYRLERDGQASSAPLFARSLASLDGLARAETARIVYVDVPRDRLAELKPARANPEAFVMVSKALAAERQPLAPGHHPPILPFVVRAENALAPAREQRQNGYALHHQKLTVALSRMRNDVPTSATMEARLGEIRSALLEMSTFVPSDKLGEFETTRDQILHSATQTVEKFRVIEQGRGHELHQRPAGAQQPIVKSPGERDIALDRTASQTRQEAKRESDHERRQGPDLSSRSPTRQPDGQVLQEPEKASQPIPQASLTEEQKTQAVLQGYADGLVKHDQERKAPRQSQTEKHKPRQKR